MNYSEIRKLVKLVEDSKISELEIEEENSRVRIIKNSRTAAMPAPAEMVLQAGDSVVQEPAQQMSQQAKAPETPQPAADPTAGKNITEIKSPMVGTFYRASSPDAPPYVQTGDPVKPGQVLCILEAMKLMNEIEAEVSGKILEICVEDAQPVEFDQVLFKIEQ